MSRGIWGDVARQVANVVGAIFQIAAPIATGPAIGRISAENSTLVVPADYAFAIWTPIFLLALVYAVYQALPAERENQLLRRIGPFSALAFFANGTWELLFPAREFVLAQIVLGVIFAGAVVAHLLAQRGAGRGDRVERWLIAPALGLLSGWITAALLVSIATTLVALGVFSGGLGEAVVGALLLVVAGAIACAVIVAGKDGPAQGYLAYGGAVLWAFGGVVANEASALTSGAAILSALVVAAVLFVALRRSEYGRSSMPRIAREEIEHG
jgi:hypothetical protein